MRRHRSPAIIETMLTDAHFHPRDLAEAAPGWEASYRDLGILGLSSCHRFEDFLFTEALARSGLRLRLGYGIHPQLPLPDELDKLEAMAVEGRLDAVGECGFDAYDEIHRATFAEQERVFSFQLGLARRTGLPLVLHLRKAMDALFRYSRELSSLSAVIFHSWPGSPGEARALLDRGVNAYFSFGATLANGRKASAASIASVPRDRILSETDAPFQAPRSWSSGEPCLPSHLPLIQGSIAEALRMPADECEALLEVNFRRALGDGA